MTSTSSPSSYRVGMTSGQLEVLVEPFRENDPGPHVTAVIETLQSAGLEPDMGPFATTVDGDLHAILDVIHDLLSSGFDAGASTIQLRVSVIDE